jgi:Zn-finger protein
MVTEIPLARRDLDGRDVKSCATCSLVAFIAAVAQRIDEPFGA